VRRVLLLLLRSVGVMALAFSVAFAVMHFGRRTEWYKNHLYKSLIQGNPQARMQAASILAQVGGEAHLLMALKMDQPEVHNLAKRALEHLWFNAAGREAYEQMQVAYQAAEREDFKDALLILDRLTVKHPSYAEAWNRRAAVLWQLGQYEKSMKDCERTLDLNPNHYGAWQGLGICHIQLGDLSEACRALRLALKIDPHDDAALRSLKKCEELVRLIPSRNGSDGRTDLL
jgi:tetratricopeptide (TPR) repeat protein